MHDVIDPDQIIEQLLSNDLITMATNKTEHLTDGMEFAIVFRTRNDKSGVLFTTAAGRMQEKPLLLILPHSSPETQDGRAYMVRDADEAITAIDIHCMQVSGEISFNPDGSMIQHNTEEGDITFHLHPDGTMSKSY
jgi:hypothetical protein